MRTQVPARALARLALGVTLGVATLSSCGDSGATGTDTASTSAGSTSSPSPSPSPSSSSSPTATPTSSATPTAAASTAPAGGGLRSRLLTVAELPGPNPGSRWREGVTRAEDPSALFGTCQRFALTSIGAERVLVRSFRSAAAGQAEDRAGSLVATFADPLTARRAYAVLTAWRARCADRLSTYPRVQVGGLRPVPVTGGRAAWYLLTYGPVPGDPEAAFFDEQGMAVVGSRIAMVRIRLAGQDHDAEPGREPVVSALTTAARKLSPGA